MTIKLRSYLLLAAIPCVLLLSLYLSAAYQATSEWSERRQSIISNSPDVHITPSGEKYHRASHYADRTRSISLYEAAEQGYEACRVCHPPKLPTMLFALPWYVNHWLLIGLAFMGVYGLAILGVTKWRRLRILGDHPR